MNYIILDLLELVCLQDVNRKPRQKPFFVKYKRQVTQLLKHGLIKTVYSFRSDGIRYLITHLGKECLRQHTPFYMDAVRVTFYKPIGSRERYQKQNGEQSTFIIK